MRAIETFLTGLMVGGLVVFAWATATINDRDRTIATRGDTFRPPVVASDTIRTACCDEYLEHIAREHSQGER